MSESLQMVLGKLEGWWQQAVVMLPNLLAAVLVVIVFWLVARLARRLSRQLVERISDNPTVSRLVATLLYVAVLLAGVFIALGILKLDKTVTSLLAGVGVLGLALGFAFQDIASNFMAGTLISLRRPFRVGDLVETNSYFGTVDRINLRSTAIITPQGQQVLVPNKDVFQNPMVNYSVTGRRRVDLSVGVSYGDDLGKAREVALAAVREVPGRDAEREPELFYEEFGDSSINFVVRFWLATTAQKDFLAARSAAIMEVKQAFDREDIMIPFPIRTLDFGIRGGEGLGEVAGALLRSRQEGGG